VKVIARSFKYHRPRGIMGAGSEEPNALVEIHGAATCEPNRRTTTIKLFDGLAARSQNYMGSVNFDMLAVNDFLHPFLAAGFYYKTFMWPKAFWEKLYEPIIRRAAGLGTLSETADPDSYDKGFLHCDLLIIGAGPAGLLTALNAGRSGANVILADEDFRMGGRLLSEDYEINGSGAAEWLSQTLTELASLPNVRLMPRTSIYGVYDHGIYGGLETLTDRIGTGGVKQILWRIYAAQSVLAAGATERPMIAPALCSPVQCAAMLIDLMLKRERISPSSPIMMMAYALMQPILLIHVRDSILLMLRAVKALNL
jgi:sarcosine oxidase subunit alpha